MSTKNLSTVANDVIESYGITAINVINSYRFGGERVIGFVDQRFESAVNRGAARLSQQVRDSLIGTQQRVSGYYTKGLHFGTERAETAVGVAVDLASKGVSLVAANAERFDNASNLGALEMLNRVALPAANVVSQLVDRIEQGSSELVKRVSGKAVVARQLKSVKRQVVATRKSVVKATTKKVSKAVAKTRRVARKATATAKAA